MHLTTAFGTNYLALHHMLVLPSRKATRYLPGTLCGISMTSRSIFGFFKKLWEYRHQVRLRVQSDCMVSYPSHTILQIVADSSAKAS